MNISTCPHCHKELNLSPGQTEKLNKAMANLAPGRRLKFPCPSCKKVIELVKKKSDTTTEVHPPPPPDLGWLKKEDLDADHEIEDIPRALLLVKDEEIKKALENLLDMMGYQTEMPSSSKEAIDVMQATDFGLIVLHTGFEGNLEGCRFHDHMKWLEMGQRRNIFYMLIGPDLTTLYNLEALTYSANLVVNDRDVGEIGLILRKGLHDYEALFGPLFAALKRFKA